MPTKRQIQRDMSQGFVTVAKKGPPPLTPEQVNSLCFCVPLLVDVSCAPIHSSVDVWHKGVWLNLLLPPGSRRLVGIVK